MSGHRAQFLKILVGAVTKRFICALGPLSQVTEGVKARGQLLAIETLSGGDPIKTLLGTIRNCSHGYSCFAIKQYLWKYMGSMFDRKFTQLFTIAAVNLEFILSKLKANEK